ncbi:hypothetical protein GCM10023201_52870 [Actinomycetospora corticicola]
MEATVQRWTLGAAERHRLATLDPQRDYAEIARTSLETLHGHRALVLAMFTVSFMKQVAVPTMGRILWRKGTGDIVTDTAARNDDTIVFFGRFLEHGPDSPEGIRWIERLNAIHAHFPIRNTDSLYTLGTLALDPENIAAAVGARPFSRVELEGQWRFWRAVAVRQHLEDIPDDREELRAWMHRYEEQEFAPSEGGRAVADALVEDFSRRVLPTSVRHLGPEILAAVCPENLRATHGLPRPRPAVTAAVRTAGRAYLDGVAVRPVPRLRSLVRTFGTRHGGAPGPDDVGYRSA